MYNYVYINIYISSYGGIFLKRILRGHLFDHLVEVLLFREVSEEEISVTAYLLRAVDHSRTFGKNQMGSTRFKRKQSTWL